MAACQNSTHYPKNQSLDLWPVPERTLTTQTDTFDSALSLWRTWRDVVLMEGEASTAANSRSIRRRSDSAEAYYDLYNARIAALIALKRCRQTSSVAIAARLHAAFHQAYAGAGEIDRRDPTYQAVAAMLQDLLPAVPYELAADITATLSGLGLAGEA